MKPVSGYVNEMRTRADTRNDTTRLCSCY